MIRNLKALGLALVAVFALSALMASVASAQTTGELTTENGEDVTLVGTETGPLGANALTSLGDAVSCPGSIYTGHKYNVTPHQFLPNGATTVTLTPHYKQTAGGTANCKTGVGLSLTIDMNGCDYVVHVGEKTDEHTYATTFDVVCPPAQNILITVFSSHSHALKVCTLTIKPQAGLTGAHITHTTVDDDIDITGTIKGIHLARSGLCGSSTTNECEFDIDVTVEALNTDGEEVGVTVTDL